MKSILISIKPKYCELIASGKKTVEVRKTKPKIETPFKCYIYCTKGEPLIKTIDNHCFIDKEYRQGENLYGLYEYLNGKVIGEFVCDSFYGIMNFLPYESDDNHHTVLPCVLEQTCLTEDEIDEYLGQKDGYGWHISDLVIYEQPKELSEFRTPDWYRDCKKDCTDIEYMRCPVKDSRKADKMCGWCRKGGKPITRPPQSWCYCEEVIEVKPLVEGKTIEIPRWRYEE
jgi:predicted transcriptional regulator